MPNFHILIDRDMQGRPFVDLHLREVGSPYLIVPLDRHSATVLHGELGRILERKQLADELGIGLPDAIQPGEVYYGGMAISKARGESPLVAYRKAEQELEEMLQVQRKRIDAREVPMAGANETPAPCEPIEDSTAWFQRVMGLE